MKKSTRDYLLDLREYTTDVLAFTDGMDGDAFITDRKTQLAVIRAFEVIGEIAKRLPDDLLARHATVNWRAVKGFRDVLIHQYASVDLAIVWDAVRQAEAVLHAVDAMLASLPPTHDA
jgi:uncharacterized protein with HEPN domain